MKKFTNINDLLYLKKLQNNVDPITTRATTPKIQYTAITPAFVRLVTVSLYKFFF